MAQGQLPDQDKELWHREDVRQVWANAKLYNPPGNDVHHMAQSLEELFDKKYAELDGAPAPARCPRAPPDLG